jgi:DNA helicase-2/ATP-dependent DNA helicase PcrA
LQFEPSEHQKKIFEFISRRDGSLVIDAKAGAAKTTTIVESLKYIPNNKKILFLAFNKAIAAELQKRVPFYVKAQTINSLGHRAWCRHLRGVDITVEPHKVRKILRDMLINSEISPETYEDIGDDIIDLVVGAKIFGIVPRAMKKNGLWDLMQDSLENWFAVQEHFGIFFDSPVQEAWAINLARTALSRSLEIQNVIDFTDQLYMPMAYKVPLERFDYVFVDEAQDVSDIKRDLIFKSVSRGGRLVAVGDARQAIFGFAGANSKSLAKIAETSNAHTLALPISYRCPKEVIKVARSIVPDIEPSPYAKDGKVQDLGKNWSEKMFRSTDMILCRNNKPLVALAYQLLQARVPCKIRGRQDMGRNLVSVLRKLKSSDTKSTFEKLKKWRDLQIKRLTKKDPDANVDHIHDKFDTLEVFIKNNNDGKTESVIREIECIFADEAKGVLLLSTIHKAKGLEAERVFLLNRNLIPSRGAKKAWELEQENNLFYVAVTRSQNELYFFEN